MNIDQLGDLFGPRQMRNCLPCKKRKIKCACLPRVAELTTRRQEDSMYDLGVAGLTTGGPCALRRDIKSCTPALGRLEEVGGDVATISTAE